MSKNPLSELGDSLGDYLREQRQSARMSLRQLSELAGVSNPYLSQIERGLKKPSAEILQQLAKGLQVSAESLYVKAGILEAHTDAPTQGGVVAAIEADPALTRRQRDTLIDVYRSFVGDAAEAQRPAKKVAKKSASAPRSRKTTKTTPKSSTTLTKE